MILTRKWRWQFEEAGHVLVREDVRDLCERWGVPLYMGREAVTGAPSGPWAPKWALALLATFSPVAAEAEPYLRRCISHALRSENPAETAEALDATARMSGLTALDALLETP